MWPFTWEQVERAAKFIVGMTLAYMELAYWGGRAAPLTFIGTIIAGSEALKLARKAKVDE